MPLTITVDHAPNPAAVDGQALEVRGVRAGSVAADAPGVDQALLAAAGFTAKVAQTVMVAGEGGPVLLVGLGEDVSAAPMRRVGAAIARASSAVAHVAVDVLGLLDSGDRPGAARELTEGLVLASYAFDRYKERSTDISLARATVVAGGGKRVADAIGAALRTAEAVALARDLVNTPGGDLTPRAFADVAKKSADQFGLGCEVLDKKAITREKLGGLLGVNRGSSQEPRLVKLTFEPDKPRGHVALVGKGVTFDSGGLSIKPSASMEWMKTDMAGAAAVLAVMTLVPKVAPKMKVSAYIPLTDNMLGPDATRVGDILTTRNGKTVEVLNTDAEGRLILADALALAVEDGADAIVDVATLTGACMVALGDRTAGLMSNHGELVARIMRTSEEVGEAIWHLPMPEHLRATIDSEVADLRNLSTSPYGGTLSAALFLKEFVGDVAWAHLDIAGPSNSTASYDEVTRGGTGFGVRTLAGLLATWSKLPKA